MSQPASDSVVRSDASVAAEVQPTLLARLLGNVWLVYALLVAGSVASVSAGHVGLAVLLATCKALLVGAAFMELHEAARLHLASYAAVIALAAAVSLL